VASLKSLQRDDGGGRVEKGDPFAGTPIAAPISPFATLGRPIYPRHPYLPKGSEGGQGSLLCASESRVRQLQLSKAGRHLHD
jgi:hypothetical protein